MNIIGIDPGLGCTGCAVYDTTTDRILDVRAFAGLTGMPVEGRIKGIVEGLFSWAGPYLEMPNTLVAIEDNHFTSGRSAQSAMKQREVIGALGYRAACQGMPVVRVAPTSAKKALTGSGKASKEDMVEKINEKMWIMDLNQKSQEAIADAYGVCLAAVKEAE